VAKMSQKANNRFENGGEIFDYMVKKNTPYIVLDNHDDAPVAFERRISKIPCIFISHSNEIERYQP
jgi:hypothetical protein